MPMVFYELPLHKLGNEKGRESKELSRARLYITKSPGVSQAFSWPRFGFIETPNRGNYHEAHEGRSRNARLFFLLLFFVIFVLQL